MQPVPCGVQFVVQPLIFYYQMLHLLFPDALPSNCFLEIDGEALDDLLFAEDIGVHLAHQIFELGAFAFFTLELLSEGLEVGLDLGQSTSQSLNPFPLLLLILMQHRYLVALVFLYLQQQQYFILHLPVPHLHSVQSLLHLAHNIRQLPNTLLLLTQTPLHNQNRFPRLL